MKKRVIVGGFVLLALVVSVAVWTSRAEAQGRARVFAFPDVPLEGPGSSIGVSIRDVTREDLEKAKLSQAGGALVTSVLDGRPGARAGLKNGDLITEFDGERVRSARHLTRLVRETPPGRTVKSSIVREGSRQTIDITPDTRNGLEEFSRIGPEIQDRLRDLQRSFSLEIDPDRPLGPWTVSGRGRLGATLVPLGDQLASYFGVKQGALVSSVETDSSASRAGLKAGDVITSINGRSVDEVSDVLQQVREAQPGSTLDITVMRDKKEVKLRATVPEALRPRPLENRFRYREL